ncbi:MAG: hypothetical protein ACJ77N_00635, partial [Chloroflexota bacterium]
GRDPATLRVSAHLWWAQVDDAPSRAAYIREYLETGVSRVITLVRRAAQSVHEVDAFAEDVREAGAELTTERVAA